MFAYIGLVQRATVHNYDDGTNAFRLSTYNFFLFHKLSNNDYTYELCVQNGIPYLNVRFLFIYYKTSFAFHVSFISVVCRKAYCWSFVTTKAGT